MFSGLFISRTGRGASFNGLPDISRKVFALSEMPTDVPYDSAEHERGHEVGPVVGYKGRAPNEQRANGVVQHAAYGRGVVLSAQAQFRHQSPVRGINRCLDGTRALCTGR